MDEKCKYLELLKKSHKMIDAARTILEKERYGFYADKKYYPRIDELLDEQDLLMDKAVKYMAEIEHKHDSNIEIDDDIFKNASSILIQYNESINKFLELYEEYNLGNN